MHELDLIPTLAGSFFAALLFGYVTHKLGLSPIVGYLLAGVVVGPNTPGFTANGAVASQFAEVGVVLLMFGVGLHFDLHELARVRKVAIPGALIQCVVSASLGAGLASWMNWPVSSCIVFGLSVAFASTVVVTRILSDANELQTQTGNLAVGWLIVQDLLAVLVLVLLPTLAGESSLGLGSLLQVVLLAGFKMVIAVASITVLGGKIIPSILRYIAETRSRELFTLTVLVIVLGIALLSSRLFGVSMALGAFLAGIVVGRSDFSLRAASEALPMRDAFAVLFFVSVGMLFDPIVFFQSRGLLFGTLILVMVVTPVLSLATILAFGMPLRLALRVSTTLGQIGEFSFIVANLARSLNLMPEEAMHVLVTGSIVSISIAPVMQYLVEPLCRLANRSKWLRVLNVSRVPFRLRPIVLSDGYRPSLASLETDSTLQEIVPEFRSVIVGYGPVGKTVARLLRENGITPVVIEMNHSNMAIIRGDGFRAVLGDANDPETLKAAGIRDAMSLILSASTIRGTSEIIRLAHDLNPKVKIVVRATYLRERAPLIDCGADTVFAGEGEVAMALVEYMLRDLGATPEQIDRERDRVRSDLFDVSDVIKLKPASSEASPIDPIKQSQ